MKRERRAVGNVLNVYAQDTYLDKIHVAPTHCALDERMDVVAVAKRLIGWLGLVRLLNLRRACRPFRALLACMSSGRSRAAPPFLPPRPPDARPNAHSPARSLALNQILGRERVHSLSSVAGVGCRYPPSNPNKVCQKPRPVADLWAPPGCGSCSVTSKIGEGREIERGPKEVKRAFIPSSRLIPSLKLREP